VTAALSPEPVPAAAAGPATAATTATAAAGGGACPPDRTFARLIEGTLGDAEVGRLQAHGDACAACSRMLAELARTIAPDPGDWLGDRYRLLEPLGAGGMGVVYTAFDTKLERRVAVKRLREAGAGAPAERRRARFLREARLLASLSHPNVLTVHDVGGGDGELYVVMELVDGWPMSRWRAEARPAASARDVVGLYLQVGRGLSAAHRLDVVHRDVKPENILVARSGRVLIGDFGLAGLADAAEAPVEPPGAAASLTQTGAVLGTPAYMAPELSDGKAADALSDQFSFSVSLYESLHGRRPFAGETAREIAAAARGARPRPGRDGVPRAVDRVLLRGLDADPARRYRSMDALLADLERASERRPARTALAAAALAALAFGGAAAALVQPPRPPRPSPRTPAAPIVSAAPAEAAETVAPDPPAPAAVASRAAPAAGGAKLAARVRAPSPAPAAVRERPRRIALAPLRPRVAPARASASAGVESESDPQVLLYLADTAHAERDPAACLAALGRLPASAWPASLAEHALRRRATCEMLRGACDEGRRLLEPLDGADGARAALLGECPAGALASVEERLQAVAAQADEARYAGNPPARRRELRQVLLRQAASPELAACLRDRGARGCGRRLPMLARAYQVLAESFLAAGDCREGAELDVAQSQVRFASVEPEDSDAALGCRAQRTADVYSACAAAAEEAERRCVGRVRAVGP
jgi:hypothetical protein